jgi:hypothetical protein
LCRRLRAAEGKWAGRAGREREGDAKARSKCKRTLVCVEVVFVALGASNKLSPTYRRLAIPSFALNSLPATYALRARGSTARLLGQRGGGDAAAFGRRAAWSNAGDSRSGGIWAGGRRRAEPAREVGLEVIPIAAAAAGPEKDGRRSGVALTGPAEGTRDLVGCGD